VPVTSRKSHTLKNPFSNSSKIEGLAISFRFSLANLQKIFILLAYPADFACYKQAFRSTRPPTLLQKGKALLHFGSDGRRRLTDLAFSNPCRSANIHDNKIASPPFSLLENNVLHICHRLVLYTFVSLHKLSFYKLLSREERISKEHERKRRVIMKKM
jgi:hypothetical protein